MDTYDLKTIMIYAVSAHFQKGEAYANYGQVTNKRIIQSHLGVIPTIQTLFVDHITKECEDIAENIIQYYKGLTFKAMGAKINDFEQKVLAIIQRGQCDRKDIGIIASLPKAYFRSVKRDETDNRMRKLSTNSVHTGTEGNSIEGQIDVLNCSFIQSLQCHVVNANFDGSLVCFFTKHDAEVWGEGCKITAKIKRHQVSKFHGGKETVLNYVKKVDNS